ncbi:hypothetical protein [Senegalia sp. (in: firmicutes)]|uniref:hypothetical protein n=1 Tax=Senegalia sp. (in: firmicutes) TaxID=1924098 RepID=UPI003F9BEBE6
MKNTNNKIKRALPGLLGGIAVLGTSISLYKQKTQRKRIEEQEVFLNNLLGEQDLVIDELIYQQDRIIEMEEELESFNDLFSQEICIHEIEEEDN